MAEIKSTMDMVLARAARLGETAPVTGDDEAVRIGMRLAARFMSGNSNTPLAGSEDYPEEEQEAIRRGAIEVLLRNIALPRDEELHDSAERALHALSRLGGSAQSTMAIDELTRLLNQYSGHRQQAQQQLDDAIRNQLQQQATARGLQLAPEELNPAMHPRYSEELNKLQSELNSQYQDAMDERKAAIGSDFGLA